MVGREALAELELRKRTLLLESHLNRLTLQAEWQDIQNATAWARSAGQIFRRVRPWLLLLAPLAGMLAARRHGRSLGLLSRLLSILRLIRPLVWVWGRWRSAPAQDRPQPPDES